MYNIDKNICKNKMCKKSKERSTNTSVTNKYVNKLNLFFY